MSGLTAFSCALLDKLCIEHSAKGRGCKERMRTAFVELKKIPFRGVHKHPDRRRNYARP
jgi:hypothetical protein